MISLLIGLVIFALIMTLLLQLPILAEYRQVIIIVSVIIMILYVANFFGVWGGVHHL